MRIVKEDLYACVFCMLYLYKTLNKQEEETKEFKQFIDKLLTFSGCDWFEFSGRELWWLIVSLGFVKYLAHTNEYDDIRERLREYAKLDSFDKDEINTLFHRS